MAEYLTHSDLSALPGIRHGFFTRRGGVSTGTYATLNCGQGSEDARHAVAENRRRAAATFGISGSHLLSVHQVHGTDVVPVREIWESGTRPEADGMVTDRAGVALGILAADCGPVLFADAAAGVIGACHAGWRGALDGVTLRTLDAMEALGARRTRTVAALGPCIAQASYEVGPEFPGRFIEQDETNARWFVPSSRPGHHLFDLPGFIVGQLRQAGVHIADWTGDDTCADEERFFSYRRNTLAGISGYGRNLSAIMLEP